jgi:hypothetical protein
MPTNQPSVILIHGATLNGRSWDPVRRAIDPRLRVLAPDLPGHGARQHERYTLQGGVDTIVGAALALGDAALHPGRRFARQLTLRRPRRRACRSTGSRAWCWAAPPTNSTGWRCCPT